MQKVESPILEACVETLEEAVLAERNGAHQLELCSDLELDGLTPSEDLIEKVVRSVNIPVKVMIRPRSGDFVYSTMEFNQMIRSTETLKKKDISGIVTGVLTENNKLDLKRIDQLCKAAGNLPVTIHKCIDSVGHPFHELEKLKRIAGVRSILSSGGEGAAADNIDMLKALWRWCAGRFDLIVAGKVTAENLSNLHEKIGASYYHGRKIV